MWPGGQFVTTHLLVRNDFMKEHPDLVEDLLQAQIEANDYIAAHSDEAKTLVADYISRETGSEVPAEARDKAWASLTFTNDPIADSLLESADHAVESGQLEPVDDLRGATATHALQSLELEVAEQEFLCIVGASGCGKSTLLNSSPPSTNQPQAVSTSAVARWRSCSKKPPSSPG